jgi:hypothetical protein
VLPVQINLQTCRVAHQDALSAIEYKYIVMDGIDYVSEN